MTTSDWTFHILAKAIGWLWPLVHLLGLGVCVWAYRRCRKAGYLIVAAYYFLAVCGLVFEPAINRAIREHSHAQSEQGLSPEAQRQYLLELGALNEKYYSTEYSIGATAAQSSLKLPFGPIVLVLGVWFIARREIKGVTEPDAAPNSRPPSQLPSSAEAEASDSQRKPSSGGCG